MIKNLFALFLFAVWCKNLSATPLFNYETFTLKNGLQFILLENKRSPIINYTTWFKAGSADDPSGKTGLAHYLEHLMESALPEVQMGQFLEDYYAIGVLSNAFTSQDYTYYYKMILANHLELLMRYEAGRMRGVAFNQDKFNTEKNVILEERLMHTENDPIELANEKFNSKFFTTHPYKNPIIGWEKDIRALTLDDIKAFHTTWYHPNNAFIIISGDFNPPQVRAWAEKYYGDIPPGPQIERKRPQELLEKPKRSPVITEHLRASELYFDQVYPLPELKKERYQDLLALLVLSEFLNSDIEGSLHEILVHKKKLSTSFKSECLFYTHLDPWSFALYTKPINESQTKEVEAIINSQLHHIAQIGLTYDSIQRARQYLSHEWVMGLDDICEKAAFLGAALASGLTLTQINSLPDDLAKVTLEDIQRVIQKYLVKDKAMVGILKPPSTLPSKES